MTSKRELTLTSIPERNENDEDMRTKWVPKKKHEVLKAKYKCLKKLFQIYDASVIGILPETFVTGDVMTEEVRSKKRRRKRSHMTKTDACAGTTEMSSCDVTLRTDSDKSLTTSVIRDLKTVQCTTSTQMDNSTCSKTKYAPNPECRENIVSDKECGCTQTAETEHPIPYLVFNEKPKLTRFQCFVQRIFGLRGERAYKNVAQPNGHVYAASDNNIFYNLHEKRRRRGLRFRRLRRPKKIQSECMVRDFKSPVILTYVQSVQRNCLMDTTQRQCPIVGCRMVLYGIINYNDHLNLCHFPDRKFICHYCHEGFENDYERFVHENEHIGINKLNANLSNTRPSTKKASITQTDPQTEVPEDKLKKIVSFFDKITDPDQMLSGIKNNRYSESNLHTTLQSITVTDSTGHSDSNSVDSEKRMVSCMNLHRKMDNENSSSTDSEDTKYTFSTPVTCNLCGEKFNYRRQLSMHVDLEHRVYDKFSKFHSCAGILNSRVQARTITENGRINIESTDQTISGHARNTCSTITQGTYSEVSRRKSEETLSCDPSTNIVYYTSIESVKRPSVINSLVQKVRSGISYKWEPGTKIIRV